MDARVVGIMTITPFRRVRSSGPMGMHANAVKQMPWETTLPMHEETCRCGS